MNFDAAMALLTEIEETQSKLDDLTRRKTSLGLAL
jgi:hypothetical protein